MRFKEFSNEANNIIFIKRIFQRTLLALKTRHEKRLKQYNEKVRNAKVNRKSKKLQSLKNTYR